MNIALQNIPKVIFHLFLGIFVIIIIYYLFAPSQADLIGILDDMGLFTLDASTKSIIWLGVIIITILLSMGAPLMELFDTEEDKA